MNAGPARTRRRGFSLAELLVTFAALALAAWIVLRVVDRGTRIGTNVPVSGPEAVLESALRALKRDVAAAGTGGPGPTEAIRPLADNTSPGGPFRYRTLPGATVAVRPGTDQLGLRGVVRSPLVRLAAGASSGFADRLRADPRAVPLRLPGGSEVASTRARLRETAPPGKSFFLVRDAAGRWAVARVVSAGGEGKADLDLVLDFADEDARAWNAAKDPEAAAKLGDPSAGGVFDDLAWFVAQGPEGRPPDYVSASDPESLAFPHPYLAVATAVGGDRWDVRKIGVDVEDLQVAWGFAGSGATLDWRAAVPGSPAPRPEELADPSGAPRLRALKLALVARAPQRLPRSSGAPPPEFVVPLNGPDPEKFPLAAPIGWDPAPQRRIRFDRETREEVVPTPALTAPARENRASGV
jgi:hypothetical protein